MGKRSFMKRIRKKQKATGDSFSSARRKMLNKPDEEENRCYNGNHPRDINGVCTVDGGKSG